MSRSFSPILPFRIALAAALATSAGPSSVRADAPPSFANDILPLFEARCAACHYPEVDLEGGLDLSTHALAMKGGKAGPSILPGNAADSLLVKMIEGAVEPKMPPEKFKQLTRAEIDSIRAWIDAGAKDDSGAMPAEVASAPAPSSAPSSAPAASPAPSGIQPISSLAFSPDGRRIAKGSLRKVEVMTVAEDGSVTPERTLEGPVDVVRAVAFSPDGTLLAAAGGKPARGGEVVLWNVADGALLRRIEGHRDNILDAKFSPDGATLATCSYDKMVKLWNVATGAERFNLKDHVDAVYAVAFSPDGAMLASAGGDRTVKLWNPATGERIQTLSDSTDAVFTLAFSPDGKIVAAGGADKMIRLWAADAASQKFSATSVTGSTLLKSSFAHDAGVLRLLFSPDGARIFTTSEDRTIKVWDAATLLEDHHHEAQPDWVMSLALSPDGRLLAAGRFDATGAIYDAVAGKPLASLVPGMDLAMAAPGALPVEPAPSAAKSGRKKVTSLDVDDVIIDATIPASTQSISPNRVLRGQTVTFTINGTSLVDPQLIVTNPKIEAKLVSNEAQPVSQMTRPAGATGAFVIDNAVPYKATVEAKIAEDAPLGAHFVLFRTPRGQTGGAEVQVLPWAESGEAEPNDAPDKATPLAFPASVGASIGQTGDLDHYKFTARAGQELVFRLADTSLQSVMRLIDAQGNELANADDFPANGRDAYLGHRFETEGEYVLVIGDRNNNTSGYRLHAGEFPYVARRFPLGVEKGEPKAIQVEGFNLGPAGAPAAPKDEGAAVGAGSKSVAMTIDPPDDAGYGASTWPPIPGYEGNPIPSPRLAVGRWPESLEMEPNDTHAKAGRLEVPSIVNGVIDNRAAIERASFEAALGLPATSAATSSALEASPDEDIYAFDARKGERILIEVEAARLGSPLDSYIRILDADGKPLERATIRCVAQTVMSLADRDSRSAGLRVAEWGDLAINDFVLVGSEILRVKRLPGYADEDVTFHFHPSGQRMGWFGTTPEAHAVDTKIYKVEIHPPGASFPPNGLPSHRLLWRNDDWDFEGASRAGDSYLEFDPPADGVYHVAIRDTSGRGGRDFAYRLELRRPTPDFQVSAGPYRPNVPEGGAISVGVRIVRRDDFDGPVKIEPFDLPPGFHMTSDEVLPGEDSVSLALSAEPGANSAPFDSTFRIVARGEIDGKEVVRETRLGDCNVVRAPDLRVRTNTRELELAAGGGTKLDITLDRFNGFTGRVPIDVLNLPFGVQVKNTGLNGILVRDHENERPGMEIQAEPWVKPMTRTIYVLARIETRSTQPVFVSEPITLRIVPATPEGAEEKMPVVASAGE